MSTTIAAGRSVRASRALVPVLFALLLVAWGNVVATILRPTAWLPGSSIPFAVAGLALVAVALAVARADGDGPRALLGTRRDALRGLTLGAGGGTVVALGGVLFLRVVAPVLTGAPVDYAPLRSVTAPELLRHVLLLLPLGVVVPEEVAFRGALLAAATRRLGLRRGVALAGTAFALWHGSVILTTVGDTTLAAGSPWFPVACVLALLVVGAGGVLFALLRLWTRTIATTVGAHWVFNALLLVGLWATA